MATINLGNIKFNWKGTYNAGTAYAVDDVVSYNGSSYVCILASTGNLPTNTTYWNVMSSAGTNGTDGTDLTTTLTTQGDIVYRDASGLARLGAGTSGQFLKTQGTGANPTWATLASNVEVITSANLDSTGVSAIEQSLDWATNTDWLYVQIDLAWRGSGNSNSNNVYGYVRNSSGNITSNYSLQGYGSYRREDGTSNTLNYSNGAGYDRGYFDINGWGTQTNAPQWSSVKIYRPLPSNQQFIDFVFWNRDYSAGTPYHATYARRGYLNDTSVKTGVRYEAQNSSVMKDGYYAIRAFKK